MNRNELEKRLGYCFQDSNLFTRALTHPSCGSVPNYERLEFLGDAVIELIVSDYLFQKYRDLSEGALTQRRADIVCSRSLAGIAQSIGLGEYIALGKGEEQSGGRKKKSILENVVEALMGAVYLDGGFDAAKKVIGHLFADTISSSMSRMSDHDYKSQFQELVQSGLKQEIAYSVVSQEGPPHDTTFHVRLSVGGKALCMGSGNSKKEAEQNAAKSAIVDFEKIYER